MSDRSSAHAAWRPAPFLKASALLHVSAAVGVALSPGSWWVAAAAVLANHVALAGTGILPRSTLLGENLTRLPAEGHERAVALTFDDGPDPSLTPRVLDLLDAGNAKATFFCVGREAREHPDLVAEMSRRGHGIENHSFHHRNTFAFLTPGALCSEIDRAQDVLTDAAGVAPTYFRAPAGIRSPWLEPVLAARRLRLASWTRRAFDAVDADAARVQRRLLRGLEPRDILLLHDGGLPARAARPVVLEVLPKVLDALATAGLRAVALPARVEDP